ncbi:unnamed protein product [Gadus morhua 'NCC']
MLQELRGPSGLSKDLAWVRARLGQTSSGIRPRLGSDLCWDQTSSGIRPRLAAQILTKCTLGNVGIPEEGEQEEGDSRAGAAAAPVGGKVTQAHK